MQRELDIYKFDQHGCVVWIGTAQNLEIAKQTVKILAVSSPADYLIVSPATGEKVVVKFDSGASNTSPPVC